MHRRQFILTTSAVLAGAVWGWPAARPPPEIRIGFFGKYRQTPVYQRRCRFDACASL
jgi:hypothetical protein